MKTISMRKAGLAYAIQRGTIKANDPECADLTIADLDWLPDASLFDTFEQYVRYLEVCNISVYEEMENV